MENKFYGKKALAVFFATVIVLSAITEALYIKANLQIAIVALMWLPTLSALVPQIMAIKASGEKFTLLKLFRNSGMRRCKFRYVLMGCLIPLIYLWIPYIIYWVMYPDNYAYSGDPFYVPIMDCAIPMFFGIFISLLTAAGEEFGWRGFMVPALFENLGYVKTILISSFFWCLWHLPILIWGGYMEGTPTWYKVPAFILCIMPVGIIAATLTLESHSVWPAAFLHAAHNNYDQTVFDLLTRGDNKMYFVSETGLFTIVCAWALAIICMIRFKKKNRIKEFE